MTASEARHFLHHCTEAIEAGVTPDLARRIRAAREIVVAGDEARRRAPDDFGPGSRSLEHEIIRLFIRTRAA